MTMILFLTRGGPHPVLQCLWGLVLLGMYGAEYNNLQAMCPEPQQLTKQISATKTHFSCETLYNLGPGGYCLPELCWEPWCCLAGNSDPSLPGNFHQVAQSDSKCH